MTRLLLPLLASSSLLSLVACGDAPTPPTDGQFGAADDAHLARALSAASGIDTFLVFFMAGGYAGGDGLSTCPTIVSDGAITTVTGGCDAEDGRFEGELVMENVPALFGDGSDHDPEAPQILTFADFSIEDADGTWFVDGTVRSDPSARTTTTDFTLDIDGVEAYSKLDLGPGAGELITAAAGSKIEIEGLGEATVSGSWSLSQESPAGQLTLTGSQTLVFDFAGASEDCVPYSIDGVAAGELCDLGDE